jgi:hypothetical protein
MKNLHERSEPPVQHDSYITSDAKFSALLTKNRFIKQNKNISPKEGEWLQQLVDRSNTVAVIEHNLEVIKEADYIIDQGLEGEAAEGYIVAQGNLNLKEIIKRRNCIPLGFRTSFRPNPRK